MRKILILLATSLLCVGAWAQDAVTVQKLNVHMMDGQVVTFLLDQEPVTKFEPGQLILKTSGSSPIIYLIENVRKYTYEGLPEGIDSPVVTPGSILIRQNNEMMLIDGLPDKANVAVYTTDGKMLFSKRAVAGQSTMLIMGTYPAGTYIIHAGGASFKFVRK